MDKYIGETEKHLERVIREAENLNVVLFFDEADALFGSRSSVSDARDRYANQEVSYLLQRIERFEGLAVLATNLRGNLDPAFTRRLHHIITFVHPRRRDEKAVVGGASAGGGRRGPGRSARPGIGLRRPSNLPAATFATSS